MPSDTDTNKKFFFAAFVLSVLLNASILIYSVAGQVPFGGASGYGNIAGNLVTKGIYSSNGTNSTFARPPLYPLLLTIPRYLSDSDWHILARAIQAGLSIGCALIIFKIVSRLTADGFKALLAVILYTAHLTCQAEHFAQRETVLFEFFLLLFVYVLTLSKFKTATAITSAIISAALYLTRPSGIIFLPIVVLLILVKSGPCEKLKLTLISLAVFAACIFPWQLYNYKTFSKVTLSSSSTSGINMYIGASPVIQSVSPKLDIDSARFYLNDYLKANDLRYWKQEYQVDAFLKEQSKKLIMQNPVFFVKKMFKQLLLFYSPVPVPFGKGTAELQGDRLEITNYKFNFGLLQLNHFVIAVILILFGMFELFHIGDQGTRLWNFKVVSLLIFVFITLLHMITFAETRFRLPLDGLLCAAAAIFFGNVKNKMNHEAHEG